MQPSGSRCRVPAGLAALTLLALGGCAAIERQQELAALASFVEPGRPVVLIGLDLDERLPPLTTQLHRFGAAELAWPPGRPSPFAQAPPPDSAPFRASDRRWVVMHAEPGRYRLAAGIRHLVPGAGRVAEIGVPLHWNSLILNVPQDAGVIYAGTVRARCAPGTRRPAPTAECELQGIEAIAVEPARAAAMAHLAAAGRFVAAEPLPALPAPRLLDVQLPVGVARTVADPHLWRTAVEWSEFSGDARSREAYRTAAEMMDVAAEIGRGRGAELFATPFLAAALVSVAIGLGESVAEQAEQRQAEQAWGACAARLAAALSAEAVAPRLRTALPAPPPPALPARSRVRAAAAAEPATEWRVALARLVLRRCGGPETSYGVDVASRWTAWPPGAAEPAYDATLLVPVAGGIDDTRREDRRPRPWETVLPLALPCRPFAAYCAQGGEALLTQDVVDAVLAAREAIATAR